MEGNGRKAQEMEGKLRKWKQSSGVGSKAQEMEGNRSGNELPRIGDSGPRTKSATRTDPPTWFGLFRFQSADAKKQKVIEAWQTAFRDECKGADPGASPLSVRLFLGGPNLIRSPQDKHTQRE